MLLPPRGHAPHETLCKLLTAGERFCHRAPDISRNLAWASSVIHVQMRCTLPALPVAPSRDTLSDGLGVISQQEQQFRVKYPGH